MCSAEEMQWMGGCVRWSEGVREGVVREEGVRVTVHSVVCSPAVEHAVCV